MDRDERPKIDEPTPPDATEEIVDVPPPEIEAQAIGAGQRKEPSAPPDQSATDIPPSTPATISPDLDEVDSQTSPTLESPDEGTTTTDAAMPPAARIVRQELPAEITIRPTPPDSALHEPRSHLLPLQPEATEDQADPADQIFPPELRLPSDPGEAGGAVGPPQTPRPHPRLASDIGQPMPRVQVMVTLASARALFEEVLEEAATRVAPQFEQIAQSEIKKYAFSQETKRRAADYRLRGPG